MLGSLSAKVNSSPALMTEIFHAVGTFYLGFVIAAIRTCGSRFQVKKCLWFSPSHFPRHLIVIKWSALFFAPHGLPPLHFGNLCPGCLVTATFTSPAGSNYCGSPMLHLNLSAKLILAQPFQLPQSILSHAHSPPFRQHKGLVLAKLTPSALRHRIVAGSHFGAPLPQRTSALCPAFQSAAPAVSSACSASLSF